MVIPGIASNMIDPAALLAADTTELSRQENCFMSIHPIEASFMRHLFAVVLSLTVLTGLPLRADDKKNSPAPELKERIESVDKLLGSEVSSLVDLYKDIHSNPELSLREEKTSAKFWPN